MAFARESANYHCFKCNRERKWFQMMVSDDPATIEMEDDGKGFDRTVCADCELEWRMRWQGEHRIGRCDPEWATYGRVMADMKNKNSRELLLRQDESKTERRPKRARWYETERDALVKAVRNGKLFRAFMQLGVRSLLVEDPLDLNSYINDLYKSFVADPTNEEKLKALEKAELELCLVNDYTTAGGDLEILKELETINELEPEHGIAVYPLCRRGVACHSNI